MKWIAMVMLLGCGGKVREPTDSGLRQLKDVIDKDFKSQSVLQKYKTNHSGHRVPVFCTDEP